jgi:hypothetical protein
MKKHGNKKTLAKARALKIATQTVYFGSSFFLHYYLMNYRVNVE